MASRIALACYSVRFREGNQRHFLNLDDEKLAGLREFLKAYFLSLQSRPVNDKVEKKVLEAANVVADPDGFRGRIRTGEYGYEADLVDVNGRRPKYKRAKEQAQILPFYFRLHLPNAGDAGVLILQRFGLLGVRTILQTDLVPKFKVRFPGITMCIWPQVPEGVLDYLLDHGELRAITLRKHTLPGDLADRVAGGVAENGRVDVVIAAKHGSRFQRVLDRVKGMVNQDVVGPLNDVVQIEGFQHDRILLNVEIGERVQTVDLSDLNKLRAVVDVTSKVQMAEDGHPAWASIDAEAGNVLDSIKVAMGINDQN